MKPMERDVPAHLKHELNSPVLQFLEGKSSHGDLSEVFCKTVRELSKAKTFTPGDRPYSYSFSYANSNIFGFSESMTYITLLLPQHLHPSVISDGAVPHKFLSKEGWFDIPAFGSFDQSSRVQWAKSAYLSALK